MDCETKHRSRTVAAARRFESEARNGESQCIIGGIVHLGHLVLLTNSALFFLNQNIITSGQKEFWWEKEKISKSLLAGLIDQNWLDGHGGLVTKANSAVWGNELGEVPYRKWSISSVTTGINENEDSTLVIFGKVDFPVWPLILLGDIYPSSSNWKVTVLHSASPR